MLSESRAFDLNDDVLVGRTFPSYVKRISDNSIWVALSPLVKAFVHPLLVPDFGNANLQIGERVQGDALLLFQTVHHISC